MVFIGITGGIGSGKSTVCSLFEKKGTPIFYADTVAKEITDSVALDEIVHEFGDQILTAEKKLDRKKLADIVFRDVQRLEKLNAIVHPLVFASYEKWKHTDFGNNKFALVEAALMFESGMYTMVDYVLALITDETERILRVSVRDGSTADEVKYRMRNQISTEELLELSDFQIHNNGSLSDLTSKVNFFCTLFSTLAPQKELQ